MIIARLGSLNSLEQTNQSRFWRRWLDHRMPSADTIGRVAAVMGHEPLRDGIHDVYSRLKRNKALEPTCGGLMLLVLDGHESHATYRRCCDGCLSRTVGKKRTRTQYYHRHVTAILVANPFTIMLDAEPMKPGEDEVATAIRLLERLCRQYPRAFDVVAGDSLYADPRFVTAVRSRGKDFLAVLKANQPSLLEDSNGLFDVTPSERITRGRAQCEVWDASGFTTWPQAQCNVRVVRSVETTSVKRQLDKETHESVSTWSLVTSLSSMCAITATVIEFGHRRWAIENEGFNETVSRWHGDHVYKHDPTAMLTFWLFTILALNIFTAFFFRNLKPAYRRLHTRLHVAQCITSVIYDQLPKTAGQSRSPPGPRQQLQRHYATSA
ncbi:MAG: transposase [bacterium]|nr:transposase [bacterium]